MLRYPSKSRTEPRGNRAQTVPVWIAACVCAFLAGCDSFERTTTTPTRTRVDVAPVTPPKLPSEPDIRVRLGAKAASAKIGGPTEISVTPLSNARERRILPAPIDFALTEAEWRLTDARGRQTQVPRSGFRGQDPLLITPVGPFGLTFSGASYPGELRLVPRRDSSASDPAGYRFDVIEHVPLERYLSGVVSAELFKSWSLDAFKAQAVAARSYAMQERTRSMSIGESFDVEASETDQAYNGSTTNPTALRAVSETAGQTLMFKGQVLRSYFSSTCGGRAGSARDTWPTRPGYEYNLADPIQGKPHPFDCPCNASKRYRWTTTRTRDDLVQRLNAYGRQENVAVREIRSLAKIQPSAFNEAGRPSAYKIFDAAGKWYQLSAEQLRLACNTNYPGAPAIDATSRVFSGDLDFQIKGDTIVIAGRGFGHGVGLCQYGAQGMALQGKSFTEILRYYYPGADITKAY